MIQINPSITKEQHEFLENLAYDTIGSCAAPACVGVRILINRAIRDEKERQESLNEIQNDVKKMQAEMDKLKEDDNE